MFAVSWLPFHAFQLAIDIDSGVLVMQDFRLLYTIFHIIAMCSTFANPLLYGWMNQNYRNAFMAAFHCRKRLDSVSPHAQDTIVVPKSKKALKAQDVLTARVNATDV